MLSLEENHITYYTLNRWALILKTVSFHDLSFSSTLAGRAVNGGPKHLRGTNRGEKHFFSKSWREGSMYLYVMWRKWSSMIWKDPFSLLIGMAIPSITQKKMVKTHLQSAEKFSLINYMVFELLILNNYPYTDYSRWTMNSFSLICTHLR